MRRVATLAFAPGIHVFPGGSVDPADRAAGDDLEAALLRAAVRETAEETGLVVADDTLRPWSHWLTPPFEPRRYDTRFFVAAAPPGPVQARDGEADAAEWVTPHRALERQRDGEWLLLPPTEQTLRELVAFGSVAEVLAAVQHRAVAHWALTIDLDAEPPAFRPVRSAS